MKLKRPIIYLATLPVLFVIAAVVKFAMGKFEEPGDRAALQEELRLARADGIPTTWQEFASSIKAAEPGENAANLYRQLHHEEKTSTGIVKLEADLLFQQTPEHSAAAKALVEQRKQDLALVDQAAKLPKCWFDRNWQNGLEPATPEHALMKEIAEIVALRGSIDGVDNRPEDAINNVREVFRIARHAEQEGTAESSAVSEDIFTVGIRHLAIWAYVFRDRAIYREALAGAIHAWPSIKMQEMHRGDLVEVLRVADLSTSPEGRTALGLKVDQGQSSEWLIPLLSNRLRAKVKMVEAERKIWAAFGMQAGKRMPALKSASDELSDALSAFPSGKIAYFWIGQNAVNSPNVDEDWESRRLCFGAILRALSVNPIAQAIKTIDLRSPFDQKPISYRFDGRQMKITVSCPDLSIDLPPMLFPNRPELMAMRRGKP